MKRWPFHHSDFAPTEISLGSIALVLRDLASELLKDPESVDAICSWKVDAQGRTWCEGEHVSDDPRVAALIRCATLIETGKLPK